MLWNCDGEIREIKFKYSDVFKEYCCRIGGKHYTWEIGLRNVKPWDWLKEGYSLKWAEWVKL